MTVGPHIVRGLIEAILVSGILLGIHLLLRPPPLILFGLVLCGTAIVITRNR